MDGSARLVPHSHLNTEFFYLFGSFSLLLGFQAELLQSGQGLRNGAGLAGAGVLAFRNLRQVSEQPVAFGFGSTRKIPPIPARWLIGLPPESKVNWQKMFLCCPTGVATSVVTGIRICSRPGFRVNVLAQQPWPARPISLTFGIGIIPDLLDIDQNFRRLALLGGGQVDLQLHEVIRHRSGP